MKEKEAFIDEIIQELYRRLEGKKEKQEIFLIGSITEEETNKIIKQYKIKSFSNENEMVEIVLITALNNTMLSNLALGIGYTKEERILLEALLQGKHIYVLEDRIQYHNYKNTASKNLYNMYMEYEKKIQQYGIQLINNIDEFMSLAEETSKEKKQKEEIGSRKFNSEKINVREIDTEEIKQKRINTMEIDTMEVNAKEIKQKRINTREINEKEIDAKRFELKNEYQRKSHQEKNTFLFNIDSKIDMRDKKLLVERDFINCHIGYKGVVEVNKNCIITPMAQDFIKSHHIKIEKKP